MAEIENEVLDSRADNEIKQNIEQKEDKNTYVPLTDEEFHRLFRNEFLTIDDPRYFWSGYIKKNKRRKR